MRVACLSANRLTRLNPRGLPRTMDAIKRLVGSPASPSEQPTTAKHVVRATEGKQAHVLSELESPKMPPGLTVTAWKQARPASAAILLQQDIRQKYPKLDQNITVDVVVVGAGLAGTCLAYQLAKSGKSVAVLEARTRAAGQSGKTSAHIMRWNDDFYQELESLVGFDWTQRVAQSMDAAADWLEQTAKENNINCEFMRVPGYLIPIDGAAATMKQLNDELEVCQRLGMKGVEMVNLNADPRYGSVRKCLKFDNCADFNPLAFIEGTLEAVTKKGGKVYEFTRVTDAVDGANDKIATDGGFEVTARDAIVYATNSPINRNLGIHVKQEAQRSYMIGFAVEKGAIPRAQWWTTEEIYHYIRTTSEKDRDILLVGGEDHQTGQKLSKYYDAWARLEDFARARWPMVGDVVYRWSGQVFEPADTLQMYGLDPLNPMNAMQGVPKRYIVTGDSGQGMTGSAIAAMVISDQILGRDNPWTEIYTPSRIVSMLKSPESLGQEAAVTARGFAEVVAPRGISDLKGVFSPSAAEADIAPGFGAVLQEGTNKVAVFKEGDGTVRRMSAICPHLGCLLEYNKNDQTFDCPCHGSQFDTRGRCINGPANNDLSNMSW